MGTGLGSEAAVAGLGILREGVTIEGMVMGARGRKGDGNGNGGHCALCNHPCKHSCESFMCSTYVCTCHLKPACIAGVHVGPSCMLPAPLGVMCFQIQNQLWESDEVVPDPHHTQPSCPSCLTLTMLMAPASARCTMCMPQPALTGALSASSTSTMALMASCSNFGGRVAM